MGLINRSDLYFTDYSWTTLASDNPKITGKPDSTLLNRMEGYEILYFINKLCELWNFTNKSSATKIEKMIRDEVPSDIHSQENIMKWISDNWKNSKY
ncbi:MAG: hypothetical protein K0R36_113 [Chryseobacterium sp.]|jgi:hypothetical protein|uniref:hypothetical protein n=1 Tax=Chryseobacterium sp. TaxID=1871047 RepID=UPI00261C100D|nr:hypothetical protein [Chryseobacterium sp.]MDF2552446.1 hypothetical protein [Chryseobacterium sp.]MDF2930782.1 hypothetical protein [Chryseobacterium sp.]